MSEETKTEYDMTPLKPRDRVRIVNNEVFGTVIENTGRRYRPHADTVIVDVDGGPLLYAVQAHEGMNPHVIAVEKCVPTEVKRLWLVRIASDETTRLYEVSVAHQTEKRVTFAKPIWLWERDVWSLEIDETKNIFRDTWEEAAKSIMDFHSERVRLARKAIKESEAIIHRVFEEGLERKRREKEEGEQKQ